MVTEVMLEIVQQVLGGYLSSWSS